MIIRSKVVAISAIILIALMGIGAWSLQGPQKNYSGDVESINVGTVPVYASALIYVAEDQHFFEENGLRVTITEYPTGTATTDALLKGDMDLSWAAEFPLVRRAFAGEEFEVIAVIDRFNEQYLFGRKDRGVRTLGDIEGKEIGIPRYTIAEFYIGRYLQLHGISMNNITFVDVGAAESVEAIVNGRIDGVITWEPYSSQIRTQMMDRVIALPIQNNQPGYGTIVGRSEWIKGHPEIVSRFLKSLNQAERYCTYNSTGAKVLMQKRLNFNVAFTDTIWAENQISLSLDQSLIVAMEDEARWMIANNLTNVKTIPDFQDYVYTDGLDAIKHGSVNIIR